jgi:APA family basic amino acid/polyamine antiporter
LRVRVSASWGHVNLRNQEHRADSDGATGRHRGGGLERVLGPNQLIMLGVGAIIGTGIFVLTGQAAAANAGPRS